MEKNLKEENNSNKKLLKSKKKHKGYARFLRNVIKEKNKVLKEIIQKRFFKWRKDALKGKIKKTVMIRISMSRGKEPKSKYQIGKVKPKEQSSSVNKDNIKKFNINNFPKKINNIKIQKPNSLGSFNIIEKNKNNFDNIIKNVENKDKTYKKVNLDKKSENKQNNYLKDNKINSKQKNYTYNKKQINNIKNEIPKITNKIIPKIKNINQIYISKNRKINRMSFDNINRNTFNKDIKTTIPINNNVTVKYSSSTKKNNHNDKKLLQNKNVMTSNNYRIKNNQSELRNKTPIEHHKKNERRHIFLSIPINKGNIGLTDRRNYRNEYNVNNKMNINRDNKHTHSNLSFGLNNSQQDKKLYNNYTYQTRKININNNYNNKSTYNNNIKERNSSSIYDRPRRNSNLSNVPINYKPSLKAGISTVIQHYSGQRKTYLNYDNNTYDSRNRKVRN